MNLRRFEPIVILTGAGISAESGIATFRASDGLWENHRIEDVAHPDGFARDPDLVHAFYNERRRKLKEVEPNEAHRALALLEREWEGDFLLVTQNVDNLHERGGSQRLLHMHGELTKAFCEVCEERAEQLHDLLTEDTCSFCKAQAMRPLFRSFDTKA